MTQQNQQNPNQQVLWVLLRVSLANLSKIKAAPGGNEQPEESSCGIRRSMTQQNQQNPGQQVLWVLLRVSQGNLSKIQP